MPTTLPPEARRLRTDLAQLTGLAFSDLDVVWREVDSADAAKQALNDILPRLVQVYGLAAASLTADWYDDLRDTQGVPGRFAAIVPEVPPVGAEALAGYATGPLFAREPDFESSLTLVQGGLQRRIANMSRSSSMLSSLQDPAARGWVRVGEGECKSGWCDQFLDGVVHFVEGYDFKAHDHCRCGASPSFG